MDNGVNGPHLASVPFHVEVVFKLPEDIATPQHQNTMGLIVLEILSKTELATRIIVLLMGITLHGLFGRHVPSLVVEERKHEAVHVHHHNMEVKVVLNLEIQQTNENVTRTSAPLSSITLLTRARERSAS